MYLSILVTIAYMIVGTVNGAPDEAITQVIIIYIASPLLWFITLSAALRTIGEDNIIEILKPITLLCAASVGAFFFLFLHYGAESVYFLKENANVNTAEGYSGANMHVYGSLIFLTGAFFSATDKLKNVLFKIIMLGVLFICAITSGRSALILAAPLGLAIGFLLPEKKLRAVPAPKKTKLYAVLSIVVGVIIISAFLHIDLLLIIEMFFDELLSGGGSARSEQSIALIEGAAASYGLGAGHGIGVDYIRSYDYPWRYESIWLATLHRTGVIGAIIYSLPATIYIFGTLKKSINQGLSSSERFFFGGFICIFLASNTNPYIEAVPFQWMYILPVVAFFMRENNRKITSL